MQHLQKNRGEGAAATRSLSFLLQESQCRKCRNPVNTIAKFNRSAAAITSLSRIDPPGWITAVAPAFAASSTPSANAKNASEATTVPANEDCAFITAIFTESTRLICPAPTPSVAPSFANTMAFDFTCLHTFHANSMVRISSAEQHGPHLFRRWRAFGYRAQLARFDLAQIRLLRQHSAQDSLELQFPFRLQPARRQLQQSQILLRCEKRLGLFIKSRRRDALYKKFRHFFRRRRIHRTVERQHAPERRNRIARQRLQIRVEQRVPLRRTARIVVLDDHRRRLFKFRRQASRRFQI